MLCSQLTVDPDQSYKEQAGDVIMTLTEKNTDNLIVTRHQSNHLLLKKEITFSESLFGFSFLYDQLDGRKIVIQSKTGVITTTGELKTIFNCGHTFIFYFQEWFWLSQTKACQFPKRMSEGIYW